MRVLILHNTYQWAGGEDAVAERETQLLRSHGHEAILHLVSNEGIRGIRKKVQAAWMAPYSRNSRREVASLLGELAPDIVHVHNFFPLLTPAVYDACHQAGVPVVQTLHNYRTMCPGANLSRNGKVCELCVHGSAYTAVRHRCYRGSVLGTAAVARMVEWHRRHRTWVDRVDRFIALSGFARGKFIDAGFPADKIVVKPNLAGCGDVAPPPSAGREGALYVGRLSPEKGTATLVEAWRRKGGPLTVLGDGPELRWARSAAPREVRLLGRVSKQRVAEEMARAAYLVLPSICYESFPLAAVEAYAHGLPVIASRLGALAEIVEEGVTGLLFEPGRAEELAEKARWAEAHADQMLRMGRTAHETYTTRYSAESNYALLMAIYEETRGSLANSKG